MSEEWVAQQGGHLLWVQEDHPEGQRMRDLVDGLDDQSKAVIELRIWGQYTFEEISDMLGLTGRGHANVLYTRAINKLAREMGA